MPSSSEVVNHFKEIESIEVIEIIKAKKKSSLFTIAIPTYKRSLLLKETLDSALTQVDYSDYDILVIDNNPIRNDETEILMESYSQYPNVSYYKNTENIGMGGNWNRIYMLAESDNVIMLHDDDLLFPNYMTTVSNIVLKTSNEYVGYFVQFQIYDMHRMEAISPQIQEEAICKKVKVKNFLRGNMLGAPVGMCLKRDVVLSLGGFNMDYYPCLDYEFYVRLILNGYNICHICGPQLSIYRIAENESLKKETIMSSLDQDNRIKDNILLTTTLIEKKMWKSYLKVYAYKDIKMLQRRFNNYTFDPEVELKERGYDYNWRNMLVYSMIRSYFKLKRHFRKYVLSRK